MSADAAGITVCLFTYSYLSLQRSEDDVFSRHFDQLRDFAFSHAEATLLFAAID